MTELNSNYRSRGDRDETINHVIAQKTTRLDTTEWGLCKELKFDYTAKWYIHTPEIVKFCRILRYKQIP